ncbi:cupredoxin domain-containing protein [Corynebacterium epidermidicanis]|uniref:Uncharacterized protein n=1 Tax=Corynebacterium epidermidicanis TaxID=1050174 RepID=A0A0G3GTJ5_9CORY|nr:hypothetical protein [Corynebacterium epidermidicanis]AKK02873.1 hypothetical protein CEPID_05020 [Corynebacterium epidermidicanis]
MTDSPKNTPSWFDPVSNKNDAGLWAAWVLLGLAITAVITLVVIALTPIQDSGERKSLASEASQGSRVVRQEIVVKSSAIQPRIITVSAGSRLLLSVKNDTSETIELQLAKKTSDPIEPAGTALFDAGVINTNQSGWLNVDGASDQMRSFSVRVEGSSTESSSEKDDLPLDRSDRLRDPGPGFQAKSATFEGAGAENTHRERLVISKEAAEVFPGLKQQRILVNGKVSPDPVRGKPGDKFETTVVNKTGAEYRLDVQGVDSGAIVTVPAGEEKTYTFSFNKPGTWMYRGVPASGDASIVESFSGAVIIEVPGAPAVDSDLVLVASDIFIGPEIVSPLQNDIRLGQADLAAFNGIPNQYDHRPIQVERGKQIRVWLVNIGPVGDLSFVIHGTTFEDVYQDGRISNGDGRSAVSLQPGQGGFVDVVFEDQGKYVFENHRLVSSYRGQHGVFEVT